MWKSIGTHVYLVPSVPLVPGNPNENLNGGPLLEAEYYQQLADADPADVTLLDAGTFLRDADGVYGWRMPCVTGGEPGCDAQNTVGVRWTDGFHFCTDIAFATARVPRGRGSGRRTPRRRGGGHKGSSRRSKR